ncbi:hypothetical protein H0H92_012635, partial [Tricholoma furcatifolium]
ADDPKDIVSGKRKRSLTERAHDAAKSVKKLGNTPNITECDELDRLFYFPNPPSPSRPCPAFHQKEPQH